MRQELELAKAELTTKGKQMGLGAGLFGGAGVFGVYAFGALTAAVILALSLAMTGWLQRYCRDRIRRIEASCAHGQAQGGGGHAANARTDMHSVKADVESTKQHAKEGRQ